MNAKKQVLILLLAFFLGKNAYSSSALNYCQSIFENLSQKAESYRTEKRLKTGKLRVLFYHGEPKREGRNLRRILRENPDPSLQRRVAKAAAGIRVTKKREGVNILKEMAQKNPAPELQVQIIRSLGHIYRYSSYSTDNWISVEKDILHFFKEWVNRGELSPQAQEALLSFTLTINATKGFDLLKQLSNKYPSLYVNPGLDKPFALVASRIGGPKGVDIFKELIEKDSSEIEMQEIYAYYAGKMEESDGLIVLNLLLEKNASSSEQQLFSERLRFAFLAGKSELNKEFLKRQRQLRRSSDDVSGALAGAAIIVGGDAASAF